MTKNFLPYALQSINEEDQQAVLDSLRGSSITRGETVAEWEQAVADYCGVKYAIAVNSGTAALYIAGQAAGLNPQGRLITTPNSFVASVNTGLRLNANLFFVDIDRTSGNLDLEKLKDAPLRPMSRGVSVILPVHFAGIALDMRRLSHSALGPDSCVIEDAAHAFGSLYPTGEKVGSCMYSDMTIFSFHPAKNITMGEGGMVTTNRDDLYKHLLRLRNNGIVRKPEGGSWFYEVEELSGNYNVTDFAAALGLSQLKRIDQFAERKQKLIARYRAALEGVSHFRLFSSDYDARTHYHLFVVQMDFGALQKTRQEVVEELKAKGIGSQVHYIPLYAHPVVQKKTGNLAGEMPEMERYYAEALSLPFYAGLSDEGADRVIEALLALKSR